MAIIIGPGNSTVTVIGSGPSKIAFSNERTSLITGTGNLKVVIPLWEERKKPENMKNQFIK